MEIFHFISINLLLIQVQLPVSISKVCSGHGSKETLQYHVIQCMLFSLSEAGPSSTMKPESGVPDTPVIS